MKKLLNDFVTIHETGDSSSKIIKKQGSQEGFFTLPAKTTNVSNKS